MKDTVDEVMVVPNPVQEVAITKLSEKSVSNDGVDISEQEMELYSSVNDDIEFENILVVNKQQIQGRRRDAIRNKIKSSMEDYIEYCKGITMDKYLEVHGNDYYKDLVEKKTLETIRIEKGDALYVSKFFDVTKWWMKHETQFPELALGASIILGKPTHNAFQERVFSRGTYADTKLRKRLKEEYFEMSVINAVNGKHIDDIYHMMQPTIMMKEKDRQKEFKLFMAKRKNELDLTNMEANEDDAPDPVPEYGSVSSQRTDCEELSDDEDDDELSISTNVTKHEKLNDSLMEKPSKLV